MLSLPPARMRRYYAYDAVIATLPCRHYALVTPYSAFSRLFCWKRWCLITDAGYTPFRWGFALLRWLFWCFYAIRRAFWVPHDPRFIFSRYFDAILIILYWLRLMADVMMLRLPLIITGWCSMLIVERCFFWCYWCWCLRMVTPRRHFSRAQRYALIWLFSLDAAAFPRFIIFDFRHTRCRYASRHAYCPLMPRILIRWYATLRDITPPYCAHATYATALLW